MPKSNTPSTIAPVISFNGCVLTQVDKATALTTQTNATANVLLNALSSEENQPAMKEVTDTLWLITDLIERIEQLNQPLHDIALQHYSEAKQQARALNNGEVVA